MEAVEELQVNSLVDNVKANTETENPPLVVTELDTSHQSNGVSDPVVAENSGSDIPGKDLLDADALAETDNTSTDSGVIDSSVANESLHSDNLVLETTAAVASLLEQNNPSEIIEVATTSVITEVHTSDETNVEEVIVEHAVDELQDVDVPNDTVAFETEILVEKNDNDVNEPQETTLLDNKNTNNILSELGQNIELSDVLCSSDTPEGIDNNNSGRQEVFNKEELLDILEGNDVASSAHPIGDKKIIEAQIALKQLTKLKISRNPKRSSMENKGTKKKRKRKQSLQTRSDSETPQNSTIESQNAITEQATEEVKETVSIKNKHKTDSIVNVLVKDWDDDEPDTEQDKLIVEGESLLGSADNLVKAQETVTNVGNGVDSNSMEVQSAENQNVSLNKSGDDTQQQSQRRMGRVIKKKVIFDPDNPDTFTKGKTITKNKEPPTEKEVTPPTKKIKTEEKQRSTSKSPTSKMAWKKPQPKNATKQNRRLTEVDKLLMDEGAVNMMYQLTPEASKQASRKNMRTKAEFIKKLQSSTPESKEMKFRERKKEVVKSEEEAKKILDAKHRSSLSSSVKSPLASDDFENQSADDSIIYRRHSSSSYSSTCMSPRRLSDVDMSSAQTATRSSRNRSSTDISNQLLETTDNGQTNNFFMADVPDNSNSEIINKTDCSSLKEKLNTKLSLALNKRKGDTTKNEKPTKSKRASKLEVKDNIKLEKINSHKNIAVYIDNSIAEINIGKVFGFTFELLRELQMVLNQIDNMKDISVTLLTSDCGTLCSELDLRKLLDDNMERRTNYAYELTEAVRSLLCTVEQHSKVIVSGVWGACSGLAIPLLALSDVVLSSQDATFQMSSTPLVQGITALTTKCILSQQLVTDLVVLGRRVAAAEALQGGLVSRVLWPERARDQARAMARDVAAQPPQGLLLKKSLLNLKKSESQSTFQSALEKERDLVVQYWTSVEGQEVLRATYEA